MRLYTSFDVYSFLDTKHKKEFIEGHTRKELISILSYNDRNGIYSDCECIAEFGQIATKQELIECFKRVIEDNY